MGVGSHSILKNLRNEYLDKILVDTKERLTVLFRQYCRVNAFQSVY
jgi:hypothetical protein